MSMLGPYFGIFEQLGLCKKEPMRPTEWFYRGGMFKENFWGVSNVNKEKLRGVIHVGAHDLAEAKDYWPLFGENVIIIEANPNSFNDWVKPACNHYGWWAILAAATSKNGPVDLYVDGNPDNSSLHGRGKSISVPGARLDALILGSDRDVAHYNFLNIDVEGAELEVLKGSEELLKQIDFILLEVSTVKRFSDKDALFDELQDWLWDRGFRVELVDGGLTERKWGDALFVRQ